MAIGPRPQIVTIQEAYSNHFSVYLDELTRQTGQQWRGVFATHCGPGDWNGSACRSGWYQGVGIFTTFDIIDSSSLHLPFADCWTSARVALRATLNIAGTATQVFTTHLQTGTCTNASQARASAMTLLKGWAGNYGAPQLLAGDFNDEPEIIDTPAGMRPAFVDTWPLVGTGPRVTAYGPTPTLKRDYWFTDSSMRAVPAFSQVVYGTQSISDHYPVQTTFSIR
jgi:endonuclease/exonuclease/phosphatase family metal-dependent hydrolase